MISLCIGIVLGAAVLAPVVYYGTTPHQFPWTDLALFIVGVVGILVGLLRRRA